MKGRPFLPIIDINVGQIRLVKEELFKNSEYYKYKKREGCYDDESGNIIFAFNENKFFNDRSYNIDVRYNLIHEMIHKCMSGTGINKDFFRLNEGVTDTLAQEIVKNKILPDLLNEEDENNRRKSFEKYPIVLIDGDETETELDDFIFAEDGKTPVSYRYIGERRLIRTIKQTKPEVYELLLKAAFEGDNQEARNIMADSYGEQILDDLKNIRIKFLIERLDNKN